MSAQPAVATQPAAALASGYSVSLYASSSYLGAGGTVYLTAYSNVDVGPTPYYIEIYSATYGSFITDCYTGTSCTASVAEGCGCTLSFVAFISSYGTGWWPPNVQAVSNNVTVIWLSVGLYASSYSPMAGVGISLTAYTNSNVGPSPWYIELFSTNGRYLGECPSGTSCTVYPSNDCACSYGYVAFISGYGTGYWPPGVVSVSNTVTVTWQGWTVSLSATPAYLAPGQTSTITATANADVGPTPWYLKIYGAGLWVTCSTGRTCSFGLGNANPNTETLVAYVSGAGSSTPPPSTQATSNTVTVNWLSLYLSASAPYLQAGAPVTLSAGANADIGPSPYFIALFDQSSGLVNYCSAGYTCNTSITYSSGAARSYIAYITNSPLSGPPPPSLVTSNTASVTWVSLSLTATPRWLAPNAPTTLAATSSLNVTGTPFYIEIWDKSAGSLVTSCPSGTTCAINVTQTGPANKAYVAFVTPNFGIYPPAGIVSTSSVVNVAWLQVKLSVNRSSAADNTQVLLTATANADLSGSPYEIEIFNQTTGANVNFCGLCSALTTPETQPAPGNHSYIAYISWFNMNNPPPNIQATSAAVGVLWYRWGVDSFDPITQALVNGTTSTYGKPEFWGRYLDTLSATEAQTAHSNGIKILPIWSQYNTVGYSTGKQFATSAKNAAQALGIPGGIVITVDIEANTNIDEGFIRGWYDGITAAGYRAGIYENPYASSINPFSTAYCTAVGKNPAIGTDAILWSAQPEPGGRTGPAGSLPYAPDSPGCTNQTTVWQYSEAHTNAFPNVDVDEALASAPLW